MFDTHCHLTSKRLSKQLDAVVEKARKVEVGMMMVAGTNVENSKAAIEIANSFEGVYAAVGIHPEEIMAMFPVESESMEFYRSQEEIDKRLNEMKELLLGNKVLAVGEIGLDDKNEKLKIKDQIDLLLLQIRFAVEYKKSLILHNRGMSEVLIQVLEEEWSEHLIGRTVFHCCEADERLLEFAIAKKIYMGVDGDVTYSEAKQNFVKQVPLDLLVLETDSPYLLPEPKLSEKAYPNEPANLVWVAKKVAELKNLKVEEIARVTEENGKRLFGLI